MFSGKAKSWLLFILALLVFILAGCTQATPIAKPTETLAIGVNSLSDGIVGVNYYQKLTAVGGSGGYTWSISEGSLPIGLTLGSSTGILNGVPRTSGTHNFTLQVSDGKDKSTLSFTVIIDSQSVPLVISTISLSNAEVGVGYSQKVEASGGNGAYTWSISGGSLPNGLSFDSFSGIISGTPQKAGGSSFTAQVSDGKKVAAQGFSISINTAPSITTAILGNGKVGSDYSEVMNASGGSYVYTWSIAGGSLPDGLTLNQATWLTSDLVYTQISGIPTKAGKFDFVLLLTDSMGGTVAQDMSITIE